MSERATYWRGVIERQAGSGDSIAEICAAEGVSTASFYAWRKRLRDVRGERERDIGHQRPQFVPVTVAAALTCVEIALPNGIVLRVPEGTALQTLRDVLAALEPAAC